MGHVTRFFSDQGPLSFICGLEICLQAFITGAPWLLSHNTPPALPSTVLVEIFQLDGF